MKRYSYILIILFTVILVCLAGCGKDSESADKFNSTGLNVKFLDTGKSDCILIKMDEMNIVIDTADADDYAYIKQSLDDEEIESIDYLILTHLDKDHIGSAEQLIINYDVKCVIKPDYEETSDIYNQLSAALENADNTELKSITENFSIDTDKGHIVVYPPKEAEYKDVNNFSLITTLSYGDKNLLFTGDALKKRMEEFLDGLDMHFDLIKTPHHGDYYKALGKLLDETTPKYCIETVAIEDFVEQDLKDKAAENGFELFYTCNGEITVTTDGTDLNISQ